MFPCTDELFCSPKGFEVCTFTRKACFSLITILFHLSHGGMEKPLVETMTSAVMLRVARCNCGVIVLQLILSLYVKKVIVE